MNVKVSENLISYGQSSFAQQVILPVYESVKSVSEKYPYEDEPNIEVPYRPTAFASSFEALIAAVVFVGGVAVTNVLNDIYAEIFQPSVKRKLQQYINNKNNSHKYSLALSVNIEGSNNSVLICCTGATIEEIENSEKHIDRILSLSTQYFNEKNDGQVLLFNIDNGKFEMAPEIFDSYLNAIDGLKHMYPIKPPTYVKAS